MRRICRLGMALLCAVLLTTAVFAQSSATVVDNQCTVTSDGYCDVTLNVTLNLEQPAANLTFPLPKNAKDVTMNGGSVRTYGSADDANVILADLSGLNGIVGSYSMTFRYGISNVLKTVEKKLYMEIPLLCGFDYPVETLNFRIIMPGEVSGKPTFSSAFLQTGMESIVQCAVGGSLISGSVSQTLSERETMTLTMPVSEQMFPGKLIVEREGGQPGSGSHGGMRRAGIGVLAGADALPAPHSPAPDHAAGRRDRRRAGLPADHGGRGSDHDGVLLGATGLFTDCPGQIRPRAALPADENGQRADGI